MSDCQDIQMAIYKEKEMCPFCNKLISKPHLNRHRTTKHPNKRTKEEAKKYIEYVNKICDERKEAILNDRFDYTFDPKLSRKEKEELTNLYTKIDLAIMRHIYELSRAEYEKYISETKIQKIEAWVERTDRPTSDDTLRLVIENDGRIKSL